MSVQEFNDEAEEVRKAKQPQIPNRALYTIEIEETLLRNTERTQHQSRREILDYESFKEQLRSDKQVVTDKLCALDRNSVRVFLYDN